MEDIFESIKEQMKEIYLKGVPLVLTYSGGKDSTLMLLLLWEMLSDLPEDLRTRTVHLISSDTGVETPDMTDYQMRALQSIEAAAKSNCIPIDVTLVKPGLKQSFWYKTLGRGTLISTPKTKHRWCTHSLKITPTQKKLKELIAQAPVSFGGEKHQLILMLGTRNEESARRRASIAKYEISSDSYFSRHSDFEEFLCYSPLKFVTSDELWFKLMEYKILPFGVSIEDLTIQYGEGVLECGVKISSDQGNACGSAGSRAGCFTCGMISGNDPMLVRHIEEGKSKYQYLLDWKNLMLRMRNDIRYREVLPRQQYNKKMKELSIDRATSNQIGLFELSDNPYVDQYQTFKRAEYDEYAPGALTMEGRRVLLEYLLYIQEKTGYTLIHEYEIDAILYCWEELEGIKVERTELIPTIPTYDGELVFLPDKKINKKETKNQNPVFYVTVDLKMEEGELYEFMKDRQRATRKSYFFFPSSQDFKEEKIVYNSITFVVCREGVNTSLQAHEAIFQWLGWVYGEFTEKTKKTALDHLILSAIGEGLITRRKESERNRIASLPKVEVPLVELENGQFTLAI